MVASELLALLIRRTTHWRLLTAGAGFVIVAVALGVFYRPLTSYFSGPVIVDAPTLAGKTSAADFPNYYVTVTGDRIVDTGFQEVTKFGDRDTDETKRQHIEGYHVLALGDRYLLVRAAATPSRTVTGRLRDIIDDQSDRDVYEQLTNDPEVSGKLLPMVLEATDALHRTVWGVLVVAAAAILFGCWHLVFALRGGAARTAIAAQLAALDASNNEVDEVSPGRVWAGPGFALARSRYRVQLVAFRDVVWAYQREIETKDGVEIEVAIQTRARDKLAMRVGHEYHSQAILDRIATCEPSVLIGFEDRIQKMSFAERLSEVDAKRVATN